VRTNARTTRRSSTCDRNSGRPAVNSVRLSCRYRNVSTNGKVVTFYDMVFANERGDMTDFSAYRAGRTQRSSPGDTPSYEMLKRQWESLGSVSEHGDPVEVRGNTLIVRVADEANAHALEFLKPIILKHFGYGVEQLRYRIASWGTVNLQDVIA
jgi:Dna[CI] antecedent, DciA